MISNFVRTYGLLKYVRRLTQIYPFILSLPLRTVRSTGSVALVCLVCLTCIQFYLRTCTISSNH